MLFRSVAMLFLASSLLLGASPRLHESQLSLEPISTAVPAHAKLLPHEHHMDAKPADGPAEEKKLAARAEREAATEERKAAKEERQAANSAAAAPATQEKPAAAKAEKPTAAKEKKPPAKEEKPPAKAEKVEKPPAKAAAPAAEEAPLDKEAAKEARIAERKEAAKEKIEADKASGKICDHLCQANKIRDATPGAEQITHDDGEKPGGEPNILDDDDPLKIAAQAYLKAGRDLHNGLHGEAYVLVRVEQMVGVLLLVSLRQSGGGLLGRPLLGCVPRSVLVSGRCPTGAFSKS